MDGSNMSVAMSKDGCAASGSSSGSSRASGKSSSTESADSEEQEDSSSSSSTLISENKVEDELSNFRMKWQKELQISKESSKGCLNESEEKNDDGYITMDNAVEEQARKWFLQGLENEKNRKLYEAILCYKKAVHLVPDIEFKLYKLQRQSQKDSDQSEAAKDALSEKNSSDRASMDEDGDDEEDEDLIVKLQRILSRSKSICVPQYEQKATHISALPTEIILYIFRWVVSYDLDLRSLEMCSMVCRGFYLCSRDSEIWRIACLKVWGVNCGGLTKYSNWRMMFLGRPRLNFNGCYISKTTYIRQGENSFQNQFYRPWHMVDYFRYLRFFPEGTVLMLTTNDQPVPVLGLLKKRDPHSPSILTGHYVLRDNKVKLVLNRQDLLNNNNNNNMYRGMRSNAPVDLLEQTFHIELQVRSSKNRLNNQLLWKKYVVLCKRGNTETRTNFDVTSNRFSPFWFSRVKSYTAESDKPLI